MLRLYKISALALLSTIFFGSELKAMTPLILQEILFPESSTVGHSQAFQDASAALNADDVYRQHWSSFADVDSSKKVVENGALWLKLVLDNRSSQEIVVYMRYLKALAGSIEHYKVEEVGGPQLLDRTGFLYPWNERSVKDRRPTFRQVLTPGTHVFLLRAYHPHGGGVPAPRSLVLLNQSEFIESVRNDAVFGSIIQGIVAFALIYNFFIFLSLRSRHYLFYICSMFFLYLAATIGNAADVNSYIFRDRPLFSTFIYSSMGSGVLGTFFFTVYTIDFLKTRFYTPNLHRVLKLFQFFLLSLIVAFNLELFIFKSIFWTMVGLITASIPLSVVFTMVGIQGIRRGYRPAWYYLIAYTALSIGNTVNIIQQTGTWEYNSVYEWFVSISMCAQTCLLSLGLADRVKFEAEESNDKIVGLNNELKLHIENLDVLVAEKTNKIRYIMDHINIGIFKINKNKLIDKDYSKACEKIFARHDLDSLTVRELIWDEKAIASEKAQLLDTAITGCIGEVEINFEINAHCYPIEMDYQGKHLEFEWAAIVENELINGYLVSIKDVSYIKELEKVSHQNLEEAKSLINITRFKKERVYEYIVSEMEMLDASRRIPLNDKQLDAKTKDSNLAIILRNLHTMKGNARTYGMDEASRLIHDCESDISALQSYSDKMSRAMVAIKEFENILLRQLSTIEKYFPSIKKVEREDDDKVADYINVVEQIKRLYPAEEIANFLPTLPDIAAFLRQNNASDFQEVLEPITNDLPRLCEKLQKPSPKISIDSQGIFVRKATVSKLRSVFNHLVRNSLDHGLESKQERMLCGKSSSGLIEIELRQGPKYHLLSYRDDGRGIDLEKIIKKSKELGLDESHTVIEAMRNIFVTRLTTKDQLSDVSGRGIGLDAVKDLVKSLNGRIDLHLLESGIEEEDPIKSGMGRNLAFEFVILLPRELFL